MSGKIKNKTIFNVADAHNSNNIGGFNLANFKMRYLNEFMGEVAVDYE